MDFYLKGKFFPGNIYNQFETIFRNVDEFVTKDTLQYVEDQMQGVGISVKRFCSNVVQDILPLSGDIVKPESQSVDADEQVDTDSTCIREKQVFLNEGSIHTLGYSDASLAIETDPTKKQIIEPPCQNLSPGAETSLHLGESIDSITSEESGVEVSDPSSGASNEDHKHTLGDSDAPLPIEFDHMKQISESLCGDLSLEAVASLQLVECSDAITQNDGESGVEKDIIEVFSEVSNEDNDEDLTTIKEETRHLNLHKGNKTLFYGPECLSDSSSNGRLLDNEEWNWYSDETGSLSSSLVSSAIKVNEDNNLLTDSPVPSAYDANAIALGKDGVQCDHFTTKDDSFNVSTSVKSPPDLMLSHFSWEGNELEMACCCIMESTSADGDSIMKAETICPIHGENKDVDELPSVLILKPNDNNVIQTDKSVLVNASCDSHKDGHQEMLISPSETANTCENDFDMETVDLSPDMETVDLSPHMETVDLSPDSKDDAIILVSKSSYMHTASRRRDFRYYKKLIHDAFTYQKRISKEYEHLGILYGDIDTKSNQLFEPELNPSAVKSQSSQKMPVTEWEFVNDVLR